MMSLDVMRESETGGVKTYVKTRSIYAVSTGEQGRAQEVGGAFVNANTLVFSTGYNLTEGAFVKHSGRMFRVQVVGLRGMAGIKRYEAVEVDNE